MVFPKHFAERHPRQCQANKRTNGLPCMQWALTGVKWCKYHNGRQSQRAQRGQLQLRGMPRFYRNKLTKTLTEAVEAQIDMDPDEQFQAFEELAWIRQFADVHVNLFDAAVAQNNPANILLTGAAMASVMQQVGDMCVKVSSIRNKQKDRYDIHDLKFFVNGLVRILYDICGEQYMFIAEAFEKHVKETLSVPAGYAKGVESRPVDAAAAVAEIDNSIPATSTVNT